MKVKLNYSQTSFVAQNLDDEQLEALIKKSDFDLAQDGRSFIGIEGVVSDGKGGGVYAMRVKDKGEPSKIINVTVSPKEGARAGSWGELDIAKVEFA